MKKRVVKIDLHTHSYGSPDGGISLVGYKNAIHTRKLNYIAVTDHNEIAAALEIKRVLGDRIIIGEEIMTSEGEIVGLFLKKKIDPGLTLSKTISAIKAQSGLVYLPHPFETVRSGLSESALEGVAKHIDIVEIRNGRALLQNKSSLAQKWAHDHGIAMVASSDAHSYGGLGRTYSTILKNPTQNSLLSLLASADHSQKLARPYSLLSPKLNRLKRRLRRT